MSEELIQSGRRAADPAAALRQAAARQVVPGESVVADLTVGDQQVTVTDRRLIITKVGPILGERAESVLLSAITGIATHLKDGRIILLQIAVPGRSWGELALTGEDLGKVHAALVGGLVSKGSTR